MTNDSAVKGQVNLLLRLVTCLWAERTLKRHAGILGQSLWKTTERLVRKGPVPLQWLSDWGLMLKWPAEAATKCRILLRFPALFSVATALLRREMAQSWRPLTKTIPPSLRSHRALLGYLPDIDLPVTTADSPDMSRSSAKTRIPLVKNFTRLCSHCRNGLSLQGSRSIPPLSDLSYLYHRLIPTWRVLCRQCSNELTRKDLECRYQLCNFDFILEQLQNIGLCLYYCIFH